MNQIRHIQKLNEEELKSGTTASWHDQYKDSAYVNVGGLPINLTEGDVITIFSQYGEVVDINMPRDANTGKPRGFAWLMYADQRSTVLAVDNLNGAQVLGRTLRVDHVLNYKQLECDQETGKLKEREEQSFAAHPKKFLKKASESDGSESDSSHGSIDPDDPMRDYLISQRREGKKKRRLEGGESKEEKRRRKEERRRIREERERRKAGRRDGGGEGESRRTRAIEGDREVGRRSGRDDDLDRRQSRGVEDEQWDRRGGNRAPGRDARSRTPDRSHRRRGDSFDDHERDRRRGDDDRRRSAREFDERDGGRSRRDSERRSGASGGCGGAGAGSDAFADLGRWARGGK